MNYKEGHSVPFSSLVGTRFTSITGGVKGSYEMRFQDSGGNVFKMFHYQDCCEDVQLEDVCGDLNDILNETITLAEEVRETGGDDDMSFTWTFYKLSTIKGHVTLRWYGTSNGYYSEDVSFEFVEKIPQKLDRVLE